MSLPSETSLPPLRPSALRVSVLEILRQALLQGRYPPGAELADTELAAEFNVSRGPVREALLLLAEEGLVAHHHYRGFRVPVLQAEDIRQITRARIPLETLALELARDRMTADDLRELRGLKKQLMRAQGRGRNNLPPATHLDFAFHLRVWQLAGDPWLLAGLRRICTIRFMSVSTRDLGFKPPSAKLMDAMHQCYIDYLAGNAKDSARECVDFHLQLRRQ